MARTSQDNAQALHNEELYELTENGHLHEMNLKFKWAGKYDDGSTIDWLREDASERQRIHALRSQPGARGILLPLAEASRLWFVVIMTGVGIGITGAWLDILVKWYVLELLIETEIVLLTSEWVRLSDLREGHCSYGFFYNQVACCSGLDRGSVYSFDLTREPTSALQRERHVTIGGRGVTLLASNLSSFNRYCNVLSMLCLQ
jgi:chloride channel 3/4/5